MTSRPLLSAVIGLLLCSGAGEAHSELERLEHRYRVCFDQNPLSRRTYHALIEYCRALRASSRGADAVGRFEDYRQRVGLGALTHRRLWAERSVAMLKRAQRLESDGELAEALSVYRLLTTELELSREGRPGRWLPQSSREQIWRAQLRLTRHGTVAADRPALTLLFGAEQAIRHGDYRTAGRQLERVIGGGRLVSYAAYLSAVIAFEQQDFVTALQRAASLAQGSAGQVWADQALYLAGRASAEIALGASARRLRSALYPYDLVLEEDFKGLRRRKTRRNLGMSGARALYRRLIARHPQSRLADDALYGLAGLAYWQGDFEAAYRNCLVLSTAHPTGDCSRLARRRRVLSARGLEVVLTGAERESMLSRWPPRLSVHYLTDSQRYRTLAEWTCPTGRLPVADQHRLALLGLAEARGKELVDSGWRQWAWRQLLDNSRPGQPIWTRALSALCTRYLDEGRPAQAGQLLFGGMSESIRSGPAAASGLSILACRLLRHHPTHFEQLAPALALGMWLSPGRRPAILKVVRRILSVQGSPGMRSDWTRRLRSALAIDQDGLLARELVIWGQTPARFGAHSAVERAIALLLDGGPVRKALALLGKHAPASQLGRRDLETLTRLLGPHFFRTPGAIDYLYPRLHKRGFFDEHWRVCWIEVFGTITGLQRFLRSFPHSIWRPRLESALARRLMQSGRFGEAISVYRGLLRRDPLSDANKSVVDSLVCCIRLKQLQPTPIESATSAQIYTLARALYRGPTAATPTYDMYLLQHPGWREQAIAAMLRRQPILRAARLFEEVAARHPASENAPPALYSAATAYLKAIEIGQSYQAIAGRLRALAVSRYQALVEQYPEHSLADNACYWAARFTTDHKVRARLLRLLREKYPSSPFVARVPKLDKPLENSRSLSAKQRRLQRVVDQFLREPNEANLASLLELLGNHWISGAVRFRAARRASDELLESGRPRVALRLLRGALSQLSYSASNPLSIGHLLSDTADRLESILLAKQAVTAVEKEK